MWLFTDADRPGHLLERWHCAHCHPHHDVEPVMCALGSATVMVVGDLATGGIAEVPANGQPSAAGTGAPTVPGRMHAIRSHLTSVLRLRAVACVQVRRRNCLNLARLFPGSS